MIEEKAMCLEVMGVDGIMDDIKTQFNRTGNVRLANIFIERDTNKLRIIDNDLLNLNPNRKGSWSYYKAKRAFDMQQKLLNKHFTF